MDNNNPPQITQPVVKLTINPLAMTIKINGKTSEATYNGQDQSGLVSDCIAECVDSNPVAQRLFNASDVNGSLSLGEEAKNVDTYTKTLTSADLSQFNYLDNNISPTFTPGSQIELVIKPKPATIDVDNITINAGETPTYTCKIDGVIDGDILEYSL